MKKFLAIVKENDDGKNGRRIQASIIGLTDDLDAETLPWAFPLDFGCAVPEIDDKVWMYVDKFRSNNIDADQNEDWDFNNLYYKNFTEITHKECYDYKKSDAYKLRDDNVLDLVEPAVTSSVEYPKNSVIKIGGITVEYDLGNERYCVTDAGGNYFQTGKEGVVVKSNIDLYLLAKADVKIHLEGMLMYTDKHENQITIDDAGIEVYSVKDLKYSDQTGNKITADSNGVKIEAAGNTMEMASGKIDFY